MKTRHLLWARKEEPLVIGSVPFQHVDLPVTCKTFKKIMVHPVPPVNNLFDFQILFIYA